MHALTKMLATLCVLLPVVVVAAGTQSPTRALAGQWMTTLENGVEVITHDASKWNGQEGYPFALFDPAMRFAQGTASIQFKLIDAGDDYTAGLAFGYQPDGTYYFARYNTKDGNIALWRMRGPTRTVIAHGTAHEQLARGEWHDLRLEVDGRTVRAIAAGRLRVEHTLDEAPSGLLGLWTKPTATSAFKQLTVEPRR